MWVAKFNLKDEKDIYSPLCKKYNIEFFAVPYTNYIKKNKINLLVGGIISGSGESKKSFISEIRKDKRIKNTRFAFLTIVEFGRQGIKELEKLGSLDYIKKPFDNDELKRRISKIA